MFRNSNVQGWQTFDDIHSSCYQRYTNSTQTLLDNATRPYPLHSEFPFQFDGRNRPKTVPIRYEKFPNCAQQKVHFRGVTEAPDDRRVSFHGYKIRKSNLRLVVMR